VKSQEQRMLRKAICDWSTLCNENHKHRDGRYTCADSCFQCIVSALLRNIITSWWHLVCDKQRGKELLHICLLTWKYDVANQQVENVARLWKARAEQVCVAGHERARRIASRFARDVRLLLVGDVLGRWRGWSVKMTKRCQWIKIKAASVCRQGEKQCSTLMWHWHKAAVASQHEEKKADMDFTVERLVLASRASSRQTAEHMLNLHIWSILAHTLQVWQIAVAASNRLRQAADALKSAKEFTIVADVRESWLLLQCAKHSDRCVLLFAHLSFAVWHLVVSSTRHLESAKSNFILKATVAHRHSARHVLGQWHTHVLQARSFAQMQQLRAWLLLELPGRKVLVSSSLGCWRETVHVARSQRHLQRWI
jgi:hypothetical protein